MPAQAAAKMKNSVMARSRTASAERLKLRIRLLLLAWKIDGLSLVQEMRSERHHFFSGADSAGHYDFFLTDGANRDGAEIDFRLIVHDPNARSAAVIIDGPDGHANGRVARALCGD